MVVLLSVPLKHRGLRRDRFWRLGDSATCIYMHIIYIYIYICIYIYIYIYTHTPNMCISLSLSLTWPAPARHQELRWGPLFKESVTESSPISWCVCIIIIITTTTTSYYYYYHYYYDSISSSTNSTMVIMVIIVIIVSVSSISISIGIGISIVVINAHDNSKGAARDGRTEAVWTKQAHAVVSKHVWRVLPGTASPVANCGSDGMRVGNLWAKTNGCLDKQYTHMFLGAGHAASHIRSTHKPKYKGLSPSHEERYWIAVACVNACRYRMHRATAVRRLQTNS